MENDDNLYSVMDLDGIAVSMRDAVAKTFNDEYHEDLNEYITIQQVKDIIIGYGLGNDDEGNLIISEEVFRDAFDDVRDWFFNSGLSKLAAKGIIECAWDDNLNEMVFWRAGHDPSDATTNNGIKG